MLTCPRCLSLSEPSALYCVNCGRPRIAEALRAGATARPWSMKPLAGLLALWLAITAGVAFLREWKAVRDGRALLANDQANEAWRRITPFLAEHPDNVQGLLLCGQATIRLRLAGDAQRCLVKVTSLSPEKGGELANEYRQTLTAETRAAGCDPQVFGTLLGVGDQLGASYAGSVLAGLDGVVEACKGRNVGNAMAIESLLAQRSLQSEMVARGYVPAIGKALGESRYGVARALAMQGLRVVHGSQSAIDAALDGERRKVSASVATLQQLCQGLVIDPRYRSGNVWCFPQTAPQDVQASKTSWGWTPTYTALGTPDARGCRPGFSLAMDRTSFVAAGSRQCPAAGAGCRFVSGALSMQSPNSFWLVHDQRAPLPAVLPAAAPAMGG